VSLIQQNCFHGLENENPHDHLDNFLGCCRAVKNGDANPDYVRLALFHFSLRDKAKFWFNSLPKGSIRTWAELSAQFLEKFFPIRRTAKARTQIATFKQGPDESLGEAWDRFNHLCLSCPHHNFSNMMLADAFYDGLTPQNRVMVDACAGGSIVDLEAQDILDIFDKLAKQQQWSSRESSRGTKGRYEVDQLALVQAKLEALQLRMDKQVDQPKATVKAVQDQSCVLCGEDSHVYETCPLR
jgi:hypothetical protein